MGMILAEPELTNEGVSIIPIMGMIPKEQPTL